MLKPALSIWPASAVCLLSLGLVAPSDVHAQAVRINEGTVAVEGIDLFYRDIGSGPPLILLHGFTMTGEVAWGDYFDTLGASYRLIVPDLRGHGRSTNPSGVFTHEQAANDVFALLDGLGIDQYSAIGHSSGAFTLLHMAAAQPSRLRAAILAAGAHYFPEELRAFGQTDVCEEQIAPARQSWHAGGLRQILALCEQLRTVTATVTDMNFTPPRLGTITAPTLILYGDRDQLFPVELAVAQYRAIPNAYLWVLPGRGHGVAFEAFGASPELSAEFVRITLGFLQNLRPPGDE